MQPVAKSATRRRRAHLRAALGADQRLLWRLGWWRPARDAHAIFRIRAVWFQRVRLQAASTQAGLQLKVASEDDRQDSPQRGRRHALCSFRSNKDRTPSCSGAPCSQKGETGQFGHKANSTTLSRQGPPPSVLPILFLWLPNYLLAEQLAGPSFRWATAGPGPRSQSGLPRRYEARCAAVTVSSTHWACCLSSLTMRPGPAPRTRRACDEILTAAGGHHS